MRSHVSMLYMQEFRTYKCLSNILFLRENRIMVRTDDIAISVDCDVRVRQIYTKEMIDNGTALITGKYPRDKYIGIYV